MKKMMPEDTYMLYLYLYVTSLLSAKHNNPGHVKQGTPGLFCEQTDAGLASSFFKSIIIILANDFLYFLLPFHNWIYISL